MIQYLIRVIFAYDHYLLVSSLEPIDIEINFKFL